MDTSIDLKKASASEMRAWHDRRMQMYANSKNSKCLCEDSDPNYRSMYGLGCIHKSVAGVFPECLEFWRDDADPRSLTAGSSKTVSFACKKCSTLYMTKIERFLMAAGCGSCTGNKGTTITFERSIASNPRMLSTWSPNNVIDPRNVCQGSSKKYCLWVCEKFHEWQATPIQIKSGSGCMRCYKDSRVMPVDEVKRRFANIWDGLYEYDWSSYTVWNSPMIMFCHLHGAFSKSPLNHFRGLGCLKCSYPTEPSLNGSIAMAWETVLSRCVKVWGDLYTYDPTSWKNSNTPFTVICSKHGPFNIRLHSFLREKCCPECKITVKESKGVRALKKFLHTGSIGYKQEHWFEDLRGDLKRVNKPLPYDFIASINNMSVLIEYDGQQHFIPMGYDDGEEKFRCTRRYDFMKDKYAVDHNISLIRIPYWAESTDMIEVLIKAIVEINKGRIVYCSYEHFMHDVPSLEHIRLTWLSK